MKITLATQTMEKNSLLSYLKKLPPEIRLRVMVAATSDGMLIKKAIRSADCEVVQFLAPWIRDIDKLGPDGFGVLHHAALAHGVSPPRHVRVVRLLVSLGASINIVTADKMETPLSLLCSSEYTHPEVASILLELGANYRLQNIHGNNAINVAVQNNRFDLINMLRRSGSFDFTETDMGRSHMHYACKNLEMVKLLYTLGVSVNSINLVDGYAPIHCAAEYGGEETLRFLVSMGASVHVLTNGRNSVLHCTLRNVGTARRKIKFLLKEGADPNIRNIENYTVRSLIEMRRYNHPKIEKLLREAELESGSYRAVRAYIRGMCRNIVSKIVNI